MAKQRTQRELERILEYYSTQYHNGKSIVSDDVYDGLLDELTARYPNSVFLSHVGAEVINDTKIKLPYYMGSLDKVKSSHDINKWIDKYSTGPYVISDKIDGVSGLLCIDLNDNNINLYTRGNGTYGRNINKYIDYIKWISGVKKNILKLDLNYGNKYEFVIRGELVFSKNINIDGYFNLRNAISSVINSKKKTKLQNNIIFLAYTIIHPSLNKSQQMAVLKQINAHIVHHSIHNNINEQILNNILIERKQHSNYDIDGIVIEDSSQIHKTPINTNPDYAFAFKNNSLLQSLQTIVKKIVWSVSKDGYIKPKVLVDDVVIDGTTIKYATAHNAKYIVDNKLGKGSVIKIIKSGDVIPYIQKIISSTIAELPTDVNYKWSDNNVDIIITDDSKEQLIKQLTFFFRTINAKYVSIGLVTKFVNNGFNSIRKILELSIDDMCKIDGLSATSATKIHSSIHTTLQNIKLHTLMTASQLFGRGIGIKMIASVVNNISNILDIDTDDIYVELKKIDGFDNKTINKFIAGIAPFKRFYERIQKYIKLRSLQNQSNDNINSTICKDVVAVFTGFRSDALKQFIINNGGRVEDSLTKKANLVICDKDNNSSKIKQAKDKNILVMTHDKFYEKYKN